VDPFPSFASFSSGNAVLEVTWELGSRFHAMLHDPPVIFFFTPLIRLQGTMKTRVVNPLDLCFREPLGYSRGVILWVSSLGGQDRVHSQAWLSESPPFSDRKDMSRPYPYLPAQTTLTPRKTDPDPPSKFFPPFPPKDVTFFAIGIPTLFLGPALIPSIFPRIHWVPPNFTPSHFLLPNPPLFGIFCTIFFHKSLFHAFLHRLP